MLFPDLLQGNQRSPAPHSSNEERGGQTGLLLIFLCMDCLHLIHPQLSYQSFRCVWSICSTCSNAREQQDCPVGMGEYLRPQFRSPQVLWTGKSVLDSCISRGGIEKGKQEENNARGGMVVRLWSQQFTNYYEIRSWDGKEKQFSKSLAACAL